MHIDEIHKVTRRALAAAVKAATDGIDYYQQRIKELQGVIVAANKAMADEVFPTAAQPLPRMDPELQQSLDDIARGAGVSNDPATAVVKFT